MYPTGFTSIFFPSQKSVKSKACQILPNKLDLPYNPKYIYYKPLEYEWEVKQLTILFKQWFPLEYPQEFYDSLLDGKSYFTLLSVYEDTYPIILGCLIYEVKPLDYSLTTLPLASINKENRCVYIMALGVVEEARKQGIGTSLLQKAFDYVKKDSNVKCIYLDMIVYNKTAIRCYEKNGFVCVTTRKGYYEISKDEIHDSLVYCFYIHGGQKPQKGSGFKRENLPYGYLNPFYTDIIKIQKSNIS